MLERLKRVNARQPAEEDVRVRVSVLVAVLAAALAVVQEGVGGPAFKLLVVAGLPAVYWYSWRTRHRQGFVVKLVVAAGAILALGWFLHSIAAQPDGTVADAAVPLAQLLLLIQVLHGLDVPARRDLLFSLLSSAVLMAVAGVLSVSIGLAPYLLVWAVAATCALVLAHRSELSEVPALAPVRGRGLTRRGWLRPVSAVMALTLVGGLGLFFVVPPAGTSRALLFPAQILQHLPLPLPGELSNPSLGSGDPGFSSGTRKGRHATASPFGYFGFSNTVDLAVRGRPNHTVVMRVRAAKAALWRGQTFDVWNGRTWTNSDQACTVRRSSPCTESLDGSLPLVVPPPTEGGFEFIHGSELVQTFYVAKPGPNLIFGAAPISELYFPDRPVYELPDGTIRAGVDVGKGTVYTVVSRPPAVDADGLRRADGNSNGTPLAIARRYAVPPVITPRVQDLAQQATGGASTTYDKVIALEQWMARNTSYTLDIPPLPRGADPVDQFLFVDRRGFCEQIATSLAVMLRSLGVPARVVAGYAPGLRNPFTGLFEVRASDAHLWTEVWFPGVGWQSFDPTAVVPLAGENSGGKAGTGLATYLSAELAHVPGWLEIALAAAGVLAVASVGAVHLRRRRARKRLVRPQSWAEQSLTRLEQAGAARGRPRHDNETVYEYAAALRGLTDPNEPVDRVAVLVSRAAFSQDGVADEERRWVDEVLEGLASDSRRRTTTPMLASGPRGDVR
jgi:transglutaminase-like putative cysteine protease